jgi:hypothetical protein
LSVVWWSGYGRPSRTALKITTAYSLLVATGAARPA